MGRKTKYCLNLKKGKHLNDGKSPCHMHCSECYEEVKERYNSIENNGGALTGLRAARTLAGGSFGYEMTKKERETNLRAFFHYVMPEVMNERVEEILKDIHQQPIKKELQRQDGSYITVINDTHF